MPRKPSRQVDSARRSTDEGQQVIALRDLLPGTRFDHWLLYLPLDADISRHPERWSRDPAIVEAARERLRLFGELVGTELARGNTGILRAIADAADAYRAHKPSPDLRRIGVLDCFVEAFRHDRPAPTVREIVAHLAGMGDRVDEKTVRNICAALGRTPSPGRRGRPRKNSGRNAPKSPD